MPGDLITRVPEQLGTTGWGGGQAVTLPALNRDGVGWAHLGAARLVLVGFELLREGFPKALLFDELQE